MTVLLRTDFTPLTAPIATLVQAGLFDSLTAAAGANLVYQASGGPLQGIIQDPIMKLTWTGTPPTSANASVRKYVTYSPNYNDAAWDTQRPSQYRFRATVNQKLAGFTVGDELQMLRFFHNSGATGTDFAGVWLRRTATGWRYRLTEYLWSGSTCLPSWDFQGSTFGLATFAGYVEFNVDIINVPGASCIQVGQPSPDSRSIFFGTLTTLISGEGYSQLSLAGVTMPRIAGFDFGCVTFVGVVAQSGPFTAGGEIRFDTIKFEDNFGQKWSPDQSKAILGTTLNSPYMGHDNEIDCGHVKLYNSQTAFFGSPMNGLYTLSHSQAANQLATKVPASNIAVEPNAVYALSVSVDQTQTAATLFGYTTISKREFVFDQFQPDSPENRDMLSPAMRGDDYILRTGPTQNSLYISCGQVPFIGTDYYLRRVR